MGSNPTVIFSIQNKVEDEVKILGERQVSGIAMWFVTQVSVPPQ